MKPTWSEILQVLKIKKVATAVLTVIGFIFLILIFHLIGIISYYSDYFVLLLPDPPLPVMRHPDNGDVVDDDTAEGPGGVVPDAPNVPRILCLIATSPKYHDERAAHVAVTWAGHCTKAVFLTTGRDVRLSQTVLTPGAASYLQLWGKIKQGFEWAYDHREEYDWFYKADDDTFAVIENLQAALTHLDPNHPQVTGNHLATWETGSTYLNGGAGYVLSRGAVTKLVEKGLQTMACDKYLKLGTNEDVNMADCLTYLGVEFLDSRDALGRQRFNIYPPQDLVDPRQANRITHLWLKKVSIFPYKFGYSEMSDEVISFHYVDAQTMYLLYYLIYIVNPINSNRLQPKSFRKLNQEPNEKGSNLKC